MIRRPYLASFAGVAVSAVALAIVCLLATPASMRAQEPPGRSQVSLPIVLAGPGWFSPEITSMPPLTSTVGLPYNYAVQVTGYPSPTITLDIAPAGMALDPSGRIEWIPAASGSFGVSLRASNGLFPDAEQTYAIYVAPQPQPPSITSIPPEDAAVGVAYGYQVQAEGIPAPTITLDVAPQGMAIDGNDYIQWTPSSAGAFPVSIRAANGVSPDAVQHYEIDVAMAGQAAPSIVSPPVTTATVGVTYSYAVQATGYPAPSLTLDAAPAGMAIDGSGLIQWTPPATGSFDVIVRATNGVAPDAVQAFTVIVTDTPQGVAPAITSAPIVQGTVGVAYAYQVVATGNPIPNIWLDTKPPGMTINEGLIQWTPSATGSFDVVVRATNGVSPWASQSFTIDVAPHLVAPAITSAPLLNGTVGDVYAYQVVATGDPLPSIWLDTKPPGMSINEGLIQWTPSATGSFDVVVRATNGVSPWASQSFTIDVAPRRVSPAIISAPVLNGVAGSAYAYQVEATGDPNPTITLNTAPPGMGIGGSGLIQWTPAAAGAYAVTVRASNGVPPDALQSFTVQVAPQLVAPAITSQPVLYGAAGSAYTYQVQATGYPVPIIRLDTKPPGMIITDGLIRWTPARAGRYNVVVRAANGVSPWATQSFTIDVALAPRIWDPRLDQRFATLVEANVSPGQRYWRLIAARWLDEYESGGNHHIYIDVLDENGVRMAGVRLRISWADGYAHIWSELKPGEPQATDFPMYALAPAYSALPFTESPASRLPADRVEGMGLGTIADPWHALHTSYRLIWQITVAP